MADIQKFELSKAILSSDLSGILVAKRGNKLVRCGKGMKPFGVLTLGGLRKTITFDGEVINTDIPSGIVVAGPAEVRVAETANR